MKVAKSSRVTLGTGEALKPPRFGGGAKKAVGDHQNPMNDIDLTLSNKAPKQKANQALLPQSMSTQEDELPSNGFEAGANNNRKPY